MMTGYPLSTNHVVNKVGQINFSGNTIPHTWYGEICLENRKPDLAAIVILAEIVYWYRPAPIKNEMTGNFTGYQKKFKADKLQRSYSSFHNQFGLSKAQVKRATDHLESLGLITKEFRAVTLPDGNTMGNVLFIDLDPIRLAEITYPRESENTPSSIQMSEEVQENPIGPSVDIDTNTESTTENVTENLPVFPTKQNGETLPKKRKTNPLWELGLALAEVCSVNFAMNQGQILREAKFILKGGGTPEMVREQYGPGGWWYQHDFRGQKGQSPSIHLVRQTWGKWHGGTARDTLVISAPQIDEGMSKREFQAALKAAGR